MTSTKCAHKGLHLDSTAYAAEVGYRRPDETKRVAATTALGLVDSKGRSKGLHTGGARSQPVPAVAPSPETFPGPIVLPGDDLALDPRYPAQSLRSWIREKDRNEMTSDRRIVYVAAPPRAEDDVKYMRTWTQPRLKEKGSSEKVIKPPTEDIVNYLSAFYHGLPVKLLPSTSHAFTRWDGVKIQNTQRLSTYAPSFVGFNTSSECIRIRTRPSPDSTFIAQLNLDDLLDAAISMLPRDAYALLLLVEHDLFESDEDEFVCGRAYGGSRVAVISTARYNPALDFHENIEREHAWPASHCETYLQRCLSSWTSQLPKSRAKKATQGSRSGLRASDAILLSDDDSFAQVDASPLQAAITAHSSLPPIDSVATLAGLWLGRVCRTASHELGHCFGMDHCVYYACSMQGTASLIEDTRQPPYLCPVDLEKLLRATGASEEGHLRALLENCSKHQESHLFAAFAAWIRRRLKDLGLEQSSGS